MNLQGELENTMSRVKIQTYIKILREGYKLLQEKLTNTATHIYVMKKEDIK